MRWIGKAGLAVATALVTGGALAEPAKLHIVYSGDVRGTVGICG